MQEALVNRQVDVLGERAQTVADAWAELNDHCFSRLIPADQLAFRDVRSRATQQLVELQAMLQL